MSDQIFQIFSILLELDSSLLGFCLWYMNSFGGLRLLSFGGH